jgi:predicted P-loop ATPase
LANVAAVLRLHPLLAGRLSFDELKQATTCRDLPWDGCQGWRDWTDTDDSALAEWLQLKGLMAKTTICAEAANLVASEVRRHPVQEYLDGLAWDGTQRLTNWLALLGVWVPARDAAPEELRAVRAKLAYLQQAGRCWMISAVARIYAPGCKADHALILEGPQGMLKSSALAALVPDPSWFTDEIADLGSKDAAQDLRGKWIIELGELSAMKRGEVERVKAFMSRSVDHYRPSYGRRSRDYPRGCVFAGSTNADTYLADESGGRRFWPVAVGEIDLAALRRDRDQLWAEAVVAYRAGEKWWLDPEAEKAAAAEQAGRRIADPWEQHVMAGAKATWAAWVAKARNAAPVTIDGVLSALNLPSERRDQGAANRVARIFKAHGWQRVQRRVNGERTWIYEPPPDGRDGAGRHQSDPDVTSCHQYDEGQLVTASPSISAGFSPLSPVSPVSPVATHIREGIHPSWGDSPGRSARMSPGN